MCALFKSKKKEPVKVEEREEDLDDELDELDDEEEDEEEEMSEKVKQIKKTIKEPVEEEIPEPPQPERNLDIVKADLKLQASRHYEIVNQLKGKITEKSDLKYGGVKSKDELYREFVHTDYMIKVIVSEMVENHGITEKEIEVLIKSAKNMDIEELI